MQEQVQQGVSSSSQVVQAGAKAPMNTPRGAARSDLRQSGGSHHKDSLGSSGRSTPGKKKMLQNLAVLEASISKD